MNRAAARRRGKRKEAAKREARAMDLMWRRLSDTEHKHQGSGDTITGFYYTPYTPVTRDGGYGVITDTTV